jgi:hypothetical protein
LGEWGIISARRWREHAMWQASRRVVGYLIGLPQKTIQRRMAEQDYSGERLGSPYRSRGPS